MAEQVRERKREPEPRQSAYDQHMQLLNDRARQRAQGRIIINGAEIDFQQNRQSFVKSLLNMNDWDTVGVPYWSIFTQVIKTQSGRHTHQGGVYIYVLEGRGYTIVDGERYDWEEGDLLLLPIQPGGCEHQHFNEDPQKPAMWMAWRFWPLSEPALIHRTQQAEHPDWIKANK